MHTFMWSVLARLLVPVVTLLPMVAAAEENPAEAQSPRAVEEAGVMPTGPFPELPPAGEPRTLHAALSLGPGWLALRDDIGRDGQRAVSFGARFGAVVAPQLNVFVAIDRAATDRGGATFAQTAALMGAQGFFLGRLYLGGGLGLAWVAETGVPNGLSDGPAGSLSGHLGVEIWRTRHAALTAELGVTVAGYEHEAWEMGGLRVGMIVY